MAWIQALGEVGLHLAFFGIVTAAAFVIVRLSPSDPGGDRE